MQHLPLQENWQQLFFAKGFLLSPQVIHTLVPKLRLEGTALCTDGTKVHKEKIRKEWTARLP